MSVTKRHPPVLQVVGYKNSGKTTLLGRLIERFKAEGLKVAAIKHDGHDFEIDHPGTDTWKHASAGADWVAITSPHRTAWMTNRASELDELVGLARGAGIVLVEGFKAAPYPKLALLRGADDLPLLALPGVLAAVWAPAGIDPPTLELPVFRRDDTDRMFHFIREAFLE